MTLKGLTKGMLTAMVVGLPVVASTFMATGQQMPALLFAIYWLGATMMFIAVFKCDD